MQNFSLQNIDKTYQKLLSQFFIPYFTPAKLSSKFVTFLQKVRCKNKLSTKCYNYGVYVRSQLGNTSCKPPTPTF